MHLRDKVVASTRVWNSIMTAGFGPGGLTSPPARPIFENRLTDINDTVNDQGPGYAQHFTTHLLPVLRQNFDTTLTRTETTGQIITVKVSITY